MIKVVCNKCGKVRYGYVYKYRKNKRKCSCGGDLEIVLGSDEKITRKTSEERVK